MKLLLFDIDGTLIRSNGAGREVMAASLREVFGTAGPIDAYKFSGKTDQQIIIDLLTAAGISNEQIILGLPHIYQTMIEKGRQIFPQRGMEPCAGVESLLQKLSQRDDVTLGLLTGNIAGTAPLKLAAAGIDPGQFQLGAYGCDSINRHDLLHIAMQRASNLTTLAYSGNNTVVIGDTPADIACARSGKATAVAVASGWTDSPTLAQYQPDYLLCDLSDTTAVINILLSQPNSRKRQ
ncbi:MAG: HAD hydrolase-like protein [Anaerolineae bacterium]